MMDPDLDRACSEIFNALDVDYVGFWEIYESVKRAQPHSESAKIHEGVMYIVSELLEKGARPFSFEHGSNKPIFWEAASKKELKQAIEQSFSDLHSSPKLGEVCWFS